MSSDPPEHCRHKGDWDVAEGIEESHSAAVTVASNTSSLQHEVEVRGPHDTLGEVGCKQAHEQGLRL